MEEFLDYPYPPRTKRAQNVLDALEAWGEQAFNALFDHRANLFDSRGQDHSAQTLLIVADDPAVLSWPWEALRDPETSFLAHSYNMIRRLNEKVRDPLPLSPGLPQDQLNVLMVTCCPFDNDVQYRAISRPMVEQLDKERLPVQVTILQSPTLENLIQHLNAHPNHYHGFHFDGHGGFSDREHEASGHSFAGSKQGVLYFEDDRGKSDAVRLARRCVKAVAKC